jgi:Tol biopolymer transport system component
METRLDDFHSGFEYRWSPSGQSLALLVGRKVMLFRFPGGKSEQIGSLIDPVLGRCYDMSWSPDEQTIALSLEVKPGQSDRKGFGTRVFTVTVPDGRWTELDGEPGYNCSVNWSPDGKWISYDLEEQVKIRPEGILWELDLDAYLKQMDQKITVP